MHMLIDKCYVVCIHIANTTHMAYHLLLLIDIKSYTFQLFPLTLLIIIVFYGNMSEMTKWN